MPFGANLSGIFFDIASICTMQFTAFASIDTVTLQAERIDQESVDFTSILCPAHCSNFSPDGIDASLAQSRRITYNRRSISSHVTGEKAGLSSGQ